MATESDGLEVLLPVVAGWFRATFGEPTPPQRCGWPAIAAGQNTLLFAPTGSGEDPGGLPGLPRPSLAGPARVAGGRHPLCFALEGTQRGRLPQPPGPAQR